MKIGGVIESNEDRLFSSLYERILRETGSKNEKKSSSIIGSGMLMIESVEWSKIWKEYG